MDFFIVYLIAWQGPTTLQSLRGFAAWSSKTTIERKMGMVQDTSKLTRTIPLEEVFMDKIDDILYGMLAVKATYNPNSKELYLNNEKYMEVRKEYVKMTRKTDRTVRNRIDTMIKTGYLIRQIDDKGKDYLVIRGNHVAWEYVKYDMLKYLITTKSQSSVKVYTYLLNKFKWKQGSDEGYSFTLKELAMVCGYSESSANNSDITGMFRMIIDDLTRTGVINYKTYSDGKTQRMRLLWVEQEYSKLEKVG